MNKTAIKNFAVWARRKLREEMITRAGFLGITEKEILKPLAASTRDIQYFEIGAGKPVSIRDGEIEQRGILVRRLSEEAERTDYRRAYDNMIEKAAFDWFNRLIAMRYMELNEYAPLDIRLLSSVEEGKQDPDLVSDPFGSNLEFDHGERCQILEWKSQNRNEALFRFLLIRMCNELHRILPGIFQGKGDSSEIFMRLSFIDKDGVIYHLTHDIPEEDWRDQVQIIGWIYQYYNSELKDETFALLKKNVKITKERIPSATQLFTPDWIVRYMVENSLGRLWVEGHPESRTDFLPTEEEQKRYAAGERNPDDGKWHYYLEDAKQEPEVEAQLAQIRREYAALNPEDIRCIDPCMGSGHILVYLFDVLMQIYESVGYSRREAVRSVLENNLYGLDIDERAYQLAYFAVMMKARQYDRGFLTREREDGMPDIPAPHVYGIQESNGIRREQLKFFGADLEVAEKEAALAQAESLLEQLYDAKEYGSILQVEPLAWELLRSFAGGTAETGQMDLEMLGIDETKERLLKLIDVGEVLAGKYHVVGTNPPYMAVSNASSNVGAYVQEHYPDSKQDLFSVFIEKCDMMVIKNGFYSLITQHSWMFLTTFERFRSKILQDYIISLIHLGAHAFEEISGEVVQTVTFVIGKNSIPMHIAHYSRLMGYNGSTKKEQAFLEGKCLYRQKTNVFYILPGLIYAYWASSSLINIFANSTVGDIYAVKSGLSTGDNEYFVRCWFELIKDSFSGLHNFHHSETIKWVPYNKGGGVCKWYGINILAVLWGENGEKIRSFGKGVFRNINYYFKEGITWSGISSNGGTFRYCPSGFIFDSNKGPMIFSKEEKLEYVLGLLNSKVSQTVIAMLNPTISLQIGNVLSVPFILDKGMEKFIEDCVHENIEMAKADWDFFEISWDFKRHPLVYPGSILLESFIVWEEECYHRFKRLKSNEEELNRIFIDIYGLQSELSAEVDDKDITIRKADLQRDIKGLISYAVGCMFGRYSLDVEGLAYAGGEWDSSKYNTFIPDKDNCIPITDKRYFDDDIVVLFEKWLTAVYGEETLEQNLDFVAEALGNKGSSSREVIRNYFLNDFFKDHCATYSVTGSGKRPIYWLFDSGKQNGFKALIYMHRYNEDTAGRVLIYLQNLQNKYETEVRAIDAMLEHITDQRQAAAEEKRREHLRKQIEEVRDYDERLEHMANERVGIDLDDGVKVNYEKVQTDREGRKYQILAAIK
nr:BREX-1 system adenine-specific DNA-methyltransferase PglX [uncultured Acetatifactor sp.]